MYAIAIVLFTYIFSLAFGALPLTGSNYIIQNLQTEFVWDDAFANPSNGNPILAQLINIPFTGNQQWTLTRVGTLGASGIYTIRCNSPMIFTHADALPGAGLVAQSTYSVWSITEFPEGANVYTISAPFLNLTATSNTAVTNQMTMQPLNPAGPLGTQLWFLRRF